MVVVESLYSHTLGIASTLGVVVLPILHATGLNTLPLEHLLAFRVFLLAHLLECLILSLSLESPSHLFLGQLLNRHGGQDVPRLEHLVVVLLLDVHALVNGLLLHILLLEDVRIGRVESHIAVGVFHLLLG